ncbi:MAG: zinc ribbon domain-containing protein, partial [Thermoflexales bacterium]|nr:zinc ribbon domain-containing protein [Thermoflexales bacterium]
MLYCPKCGATNRDASRFCNECGAKLPSESGVRCPMCSAVNPLSNVYCDSCNARLTPLVAPSSAGEEPLASEPIVPVKRGLSLPTKPRDTEAPPAPSDEEPDWLSRMRGSLPGDLQDHVEPSPVEDEGMPEWLQEPSGQAGSEEMPDWLREIKKSAISATPSGPAEVDASEAVTAETAADEMPDWLSGAAPTVGAEAAEVPDWLSGLAPTAPAEPEVAAAEAAEMPDWLSGAAPTAGAEAAEVPDWLSGLAPTAPAEPEVAAAEAAEAPDWLSGAADEMPDWLS